MSLSLEQKKAVIREVTDALASAQASVLAEYRGLNVEQLTALRREARHAGVWVRVVKNNLAKRVVKDSDFECLTEHFTGPVIFSASADPVAVAKVMSKFAKDYDRLNITAGVMHGAPMDTGMIERLSHLPGRDQLLATLIGVMQAPMQKLAATLNEVPSRAVRALSALAAAKGSGDTA